MLNWFCLNDKYFEALNRWKSKELRWVRWHAHPNGWRFKAENNFFMHFYKCTIRKAHLNYYFQKNFLRLIHHYINLLIQCRMQQFWITWEKKMPSLFLNNNKRIKYCVKNLFRLHKIILKRFHLKFVCVKWIC